MKQLKVLVSEKLNIAPDNQNLIYGGKTLEDDKVLSDYSGIKENSTIYHVEPLYGGFKAMHLLYI